MILTLPEINNGERYAGIICVNGVPHHHVILIKTKTEYLNWDDANKWAQTVGESPPNRNEQALLYANLRDMFISQEFYWSSEQSATDDSYAWVQHFENGTQFPIRKLYENRILAVRRVMI